MFQRTVNHILQFPFPGFSSVQPAQVPFQGVGPVRRGSPIRLRQLRVGRYGSVQGDNLALVGWREQRQPFRFSTILVFALHQLASVSSREVALIPRAFAHLEALAKALGHVLSGWKPRRFRTAL